MVGRDFAAERLEFAHLLSIESVGLVLELFQFLQSLPHLAPEEDVLAWRFESLCLRFRFLVPQALSLRHLIKDIIPEVLEPLPFDQ